MRQDVDRTVSPKYGGNATTPLAGFQANVNIGYLTKGSHIIKIQQLSRYGDVICESSVTINVDNKKYNGNVCIDNPTNNATYIRPDTKNINIEGWAVSEDTNAVLRIFVDDKLINASVVRFNRGDVDKSVSPKYGGIANTPKAGFKANIDISNLDKGNHRIKVQELSRYGDFICETTKNINIQNKKYNGTACIDAPVENSQYIRPDIKNINLEGWTVSEDTNAVLKVFVDGKQINSQITRTERVDVDKFVSHKYGGNTITPKAGFKANIDVSNLGYGKHVLKVQELSRYGDLICEVSKSINIQNKKYIGEMCVDYPTYNQTYQYGNVLRITGWAVSNDENAVIQIYIDGALRINAGRHYRGDVVGFMNKYENKTQNAGFISEISTEGLSQGTHTLTVKEKSRYGDDITAKEVKFIIEMPIIYDDNTNNILTAGSKGIDVSQHQGDIDWSKVANSGIKFSMIRIGYRGYGAAGGQAEDKKYKDNFKNAKANGLKVGIYYYSTALNTTEAQKDAEYVLSLLRKYGYQNQVTMPVAIDLEVNSPTVRDANVDKGTRTAIANTFCSIMKNNGYTPMIYASKAFLNDNMNASQLNYDIWVAQYNSKCTYKGSYAMWQYSSSGKVSGIKENVDCNICYKNY